ncbi:MAG: SUMF1/EgtB/PvdO family nonheme iron enzyme [Planctomycetes bacterium]|nr:SUMF1/EgtB/PvdO family nonheme iron enzyme [Planctomycetota bacterium]
MTDLEALLGGIVKEPTEETRWLVLADWLEENDDPRRGELLRLHRRLLATCCEPDAHPERKAWQARIVELIAAGVQPCVPQRTVQLPGVVPMTFSFIPPGSFLMGKNDHHSNKPVHKVTLTRGFFLGIYPVTQTQWEALINSDPSEFKGPNRPVEQVSWDDCQKFCDEFAKCLKGRGRVRLPTEAEWEWACRAGTTSEYHFGDVINTDLANYNGRDSWNDSPKGKNREETTEVGSFPLNLWGLYDMHGNVWDWCSDWYGEYAAGDQTDPQGNSDRYSHVLRGGCYHGIGLFCQAAYRMPNEFGHGFSGSGVRVVLHQDF